VTARKLAVVPITWNFNVYKDKMLPVTAKSVPLVFFLCLIPLLSGCWDSSRPSDLPVLYPCTLTLVQEGRGLADAFVMLYPVDSKSRWVVAGNTDQNGNVLLNTHGKFPGVPAGEYKVVVTKTEQTGQIEIFSLIEKQYTDVSTTSLTMTVKTGRNAETFNVGKAVREKSNIIVL
jgi:hypothetical protein